MVHLMSLNILLFIFASGYVHCVFAGGECIPLQIHNVNIKSAKRVINGIGGAFGAVADGNDVYIAGFSAKRIYRFNQQGSLVENFPSPSGEPTYMDISNGKLYLTDHSHSVYEKPIGQNQGFTRIIYIHQTPIGVQVSGDRIYVGQSNDIVRVYDKCNKQQIGSITGVRPIIRKVFLDSEGNIQIASYSNTIFIYNREFQLIERQVINIGIGIPLGIDGMYVHCDGTKVLADRQGKLIFAAKDGTVLRTVTGFGSTGDVALTSDGTLFVTDIGTSRVYLFSVYSNQAQSNEEVEMPNP